MLGIRRCSPSEITSEGLFLDEVERCLRFRGPAGAPTIDNIAALLEDMYSTTRFRSPSAQVWASEQATTDTAQEIYATAVRLNI